MSESNDGGGAKTSVRLLLVDDDRLVVATLAQGLGNAGYAVVTAESAEDAENWLAGNERPDLAIIDVRMPGQGGLYLAQRLKEFDHIPFVILSAYSDADIVGEANRCGAMGYAVKPLDIPQLVPVIEAALSRAREMHDLRSAQQQLQHALDNERDISVAIGVVMVNEQLLRRDAFNSLRNTARTQRRKMAMVAGETIRKHEQKVSGRRSS
jgi:two-component system, response regulator PdtaR